MAGYLKDISCYPHAEAPVWARNETMMWLEKNRDLFSTDLTKLV
jgi:hypothetical protein